MTIPIRTGLAIAVVGVLLAGCEGFALLPPPRPIDHLDPGATPPPGGRGAIEDVSLDGSGTVLTLSFIGGRPYDPSDPCTSAYVGWAAPSATDPDVLEALVADVTPPTRPMPQGVACDAVGHFRHVDVRLAQPFTGNRVTDVTGREGGTWFLKRPAGLATVPPLPDGWALADEGNVGQGVGGIPGRRWQRTWTAPAVGKVPPGTPGTFQVVEAFGDAAMVSGGDDVRDVTVGGHPGVLYHDPATGELVLVWKLGDDGMGVVANEADFPAARLIALAAEMQAP